MDKKLTPLEILESIKRRYVQAISKTKFPKFTEYEQEQFDIIENELKDYFVYKQDYKRVMKEKNSLLKKYVKSQKELKALEIIKEKEVDVHRLKIYFSVYEYNRKYEEHEYHLTQEEYDLLKEVLL